MASKKDNKKLSLNEVKEMIVKNRQNLNKEVNNVKPPPNVKLSWKNPVVENKPKYQPDNDSESGSFTDSFSSDKVKMKKNDDTIKAPKPKPKPKAKKGIKKDATSGDSDKLSLPIPTYELETMGIARGTPLSDVTFANYIHNKSRHLYNTNMSWLHDKKAKYPYFDTLDDKTKMAWVNTALGRTRY